MWIIFQIQLSDNFILVKVADWKKNHASPLAQRYIFFTYSELCPSKTISFYSNKLKPTKPDNVNRVPVNVCHVWCLVCADPAFANWIMITENYFCLFGRWFPVIYVIAADRSRTLSKPGMFNSDGLVSGLGAIKILLVVAATCIANCIITTRGWNTEIKNKEKC